MRLYVNALPRLPTGRLAGSRGRVIAGGGLDHEAAAESKSRDEGHRNILNAPPFGKIGSSSHGRQPHENGGHSQAAGEIQHLSPKCLPASTLWPIGVL